MGINHVTILVADKNRSRDFYVTRLGFGEHVVGGRHWVKVGKDQFIHLTDDSGQTVAGTFYHFAIEIDGLRGYLTGLIEKGIDVFDLDKQRTVISFNTNLDDTQRQFFIRDPDGHLVEFVDAKADFFHPRQASPF